MSSTIGTVAVIPTDGRGPLIPGVDEVSEETQQLVDQEVRSIVSGAHDEVVDLLQANRGRLDSLAKALLEHETLDQADAYAAAGLEAPPGPAEPRELAAAAASDG
jgi:cell division protease FtsH